MSGGLYARNGSAATPFGGPRPSPCSLVTPNFGEPWQLRWLDQRSLFLLALRLLGLLLCRGLLRFLLLRCHWHV